MGRVRPSPPSQVTAPHIRVNIHHEAHARPFASQGRCKPCRCISLKHPVSVGSLQATSKPLPSVLPLGCDCARDTSWPARCAVVVAARRTALLCGQQMHAPTRSARAEARSTAFLGFEVHPRRATRTGATKLGNPTQTYCFVPRSRTRLARR